VSNGDGGFNVLGNHTYAAVGTFTLTLTVTDIGGQTTPTTPNAVGTATSTVTVTAPVPFDFIISLYQNVLFRKPDPQGLAFWELQLANGTPRSVIGQDFWTSTEHLGIEIDTLYQLILNRAPDSAGQTFWVDKLLAGVGETTVAIDFLTSPEYAASHATNTSYVEGLYSDVLARNADAQGLAYWVNILNSGVRNRADLAYYFLTSSESTSDAVDSYYEMFLNRAPDPAGFQAYFTDLQTGKLSTAQVVGQILGSQEYLDLVMQQAAAM
jgi:PKD repeat protein